MNNLSVLIYLAGIAGSLNGFLVFVAVVFGILAAVSLIAFLLMMDETDAHKRPLPPDKLTGHRQYRSKSWRWMWVFLVLMITTGVTAAVVPSRQTVLLIAASEMGERVLNHPRVNSVVDPGIDLLTTWMRAETEQLRKHMGRDNQAR